MRVFLAACVLFALVPYSSGCARARGPSKRDSAEATLGRKNGRPILRIGGVTMVFEGILSQGPDAPVLGNCLLQVRGRKASDPADVPTTFDDLRLTNRYSEGVANLSLNGQEFQIVDAGAKVKFADAAYSLHAGAKTVYVARDGSTSLSR